MERRPYIFTPSTRAPRRSRRVGESRVDAVEAHDTHATRRRLKWSEGLKLVDVAFGVQKIICPRLCGNQSDAITDLLRRHHRECGASEL